MAKKKVATGADRKAELLVVGAKLASKHGAINVTRRMVAAQAKVSEALVAHYLGGTEEAQKAYARKAKALGLKLPDKDKAEAIGIKLRAHGPRPVKSTRKRSAREVEAIRRKVASKTVAVVAKKKVVGYGQGYRNSSREPVINPVRKAVVAKKPAAARVASAASPAASRKPVASENKALPGPIGNKLLPKPVPVNPPDPSSVAA